MFAATATMLDYDVSDRMMMDSDLELEHRGGRPKSEVEYDFNLKNIHPMPEITISTQEDSTMDDESHRNPHHMSGERLDATDHVPMEETDLEDIYDDVDEPIPDDTRFEDKPITDHEESGKQQQRESFFSIAMNGDQSSLQNSSFGAKDDSSLMISTDRRTSQNSSFSNPACLPSSAPAEMSGEIPAFSSTRRNSTEGHISPVPEEDVEVDDGVVDGNEEETAGAEEETTGADENEAMTPSEALRLVRVCFQDQDFSLLGDFEDDSAESSFLKDDNISFQPIGDLIYACRQALGDKVGVSDDLFLDIESLGLYFTESPIRSYTINLYQIVEVYLRLHSNDGITHPEPLYLTLSTRPSMNSEFDQLVTAAQEGKGMSYYQDYAEESDESVEFVEEDAEQTADLDNADGQVNETSHESSNEVPPLESEVVDVHEETTVQEHGEDDTQDPSVNTSIKGNSGSAQKDCQDHNVQPTADSSDNKEHNDNNLANKHPSHDANADDIAQAEAEVAKVFAEIDAEERPPDEYRSTATSPLKSQTNNPDEEHAEDSLFFNECDDAHENNELDRSSDTIEGDAIGTGTKLDPQQNDDTQLSFGSAGRTAHSRKNSGFSLSNHGDYANGAEDNGDAIHDVEASAAAQQPSHRETTPTKRSREEDYDDEAEEELLEDIPEPDMKRRRS